MFKPLRDKILELAITGKLVPQLDSEPAVEQIGPAPAKDEEPFALPEKWKWVKRKSIGQIIGGGTPSSTVAAYWQNPTVNWITPADLGANKGMFISSGSRSISQLGLENSSARLVPSGSVIYSSRAPIGHIAIASEECATNQGCKTFVPELSLIDSKWGFYVLVQRTPFIKNQASGTTFLEISGKKLGEIFVPLPPLEEQRRIVAKLDDIMGNLGRMDQAYTELSGPMLKHFKNLVLQQAISGQLVPQLDSEPAVEQIGPAPAKDDVPFALPEKWKWIQVGELVSFINGDRGKNYPSKDKLTKDDTGYPFVSALNLEHNTISSRSLLFLTKEQCIALRSGHIISGDFLLCIRGSLGKFAIAQRSGGAIASSLVILRLNADSLINSRYLQAWLQSGFFMKLLQDAQNSTCQPNIGAKQVASFIVPLPPIEEQRRIVARIEELFGDVDKLLEWQQFA